MVSAAGVMGAVGMVSMINGAAFAHDVDQHRVSTPQAEFVDVFNELCLATSGNVHQINFRLSKPNPWHFKAVHPEAYARFDSGQSHAHKSAARVLSTSYRPKLFGTSASSGASASPETSGPFEGPAQQLGKWPLAARGGTASTASFRANRQQEQGRLARAQALPVRVSGAFGEENDRRRSVDSTDNRRRRMDGKDKDKKTPPDGMPASPENVVVSVNVQGEMVSLARSGGSGSADLHLFAFYHKNSEAVEVTCTLTASLPEGNARSLKDEARDTLAVLAEYEDVSDARRIWDREVASGGRVILDLFAPHQGRRSVRLVLDLSTRK